MSGEPATQGINSGLWVALDQAFDRSGARAAEVLHGKDARHAHAADKRQVVSASVPHTAATLASSPTSSAFRTLWNSPSAMLLAARLERPARAVAAEDSTRRTSQPFARCSWTERQYALTGQPA